MQGEKPQQGIVKETKRIAIGTVIMLIVMLVVYAVLDRFTIGVLLGGLLGSAYAIFNFFMLGMTLQKAAAITVRVGWACWCSRFWLLRFRLWKAFRV